MCQYLAETQPQILAALQMSVPAVCPMCHSQTIVMTYFPVGLKGGCYHFVVIEQSKESITSKQEMITRNNQAEGCYITCCITCSNDTSHVTSHAAMIHHMLHHMQQ